MEKIILMGANPVIPMLLGVGIYLWAMAGWWYLGRPYMGLMWFFYGMANLALIGDALKTMGKI